MIIAAFFSAQLKSNGITELVFTKWERKVVTCYNIELFDAVKWHHDIVKVESFHAIAL